MGGYPKPLADCPNCSAGDWVCPRCKSQAEDARKGLAELRAAVIEEQRLSALKCRSLAEKLEAAERRAGELEETLLSIAQWCESYPVQRFPAPSDAVIKAAHEAAKAHGSSSDALHGTWARRLLAGIGEEARAALAGEKEA